MLSKSLIVILLLVVIVLGAIYFFGNSSGDSEKSEKTEKIETSTNKSTEKVDKETECENIRDDKVEEGFAISKEEAEKICKKKGFKSDNCSVEKFNAVDYFKNNLRFLNLIIKKPLLLKFSCWTSFKNLNAKAREHFETKFSSELKKVRDSVYKNFSSDSFLKLEGKLEDYKIESVYDENGCADLSQMLENIYCYLLVNLENNLILSSCDKTNRSNLIYVLMGDEKFRNEQYKLVQIKGKTIKLSNLYTTVLILMANEFIDYCQLNYS